MISILSSHLLATFLTLRPLLAQDDTGANNAAAAAGGAVGGIIGLIVGLIIIVALWKVFVKAGQPGWAAIIPIVNLYFLCKVAGRPGWWVILMLIPFVNFIIFIIISIDVAKNFGKGVGFGLGLAFLGFIFYPVLGFGSATYQGPAAPATV
jgi:hypothetical protein